MGRRISVSKGVGGKTQAFPARGDVSGPRRAIAGGDGKTPFYSALACGLEVAFEPPQVVEMTKLYKKTLQSEWFSSEFRSQTLHCHIQRADRIWTQLPC